MNAGHTLPTRVFFLPYSLIFPREFGGPEFPQILKHGDPQPVICCSQTLYQFICTMCTIKVPKVIKNIACIIGLPTTYGVVPVYSYDVTWV